MPDDNTPEHANRPAQPAPASTPSLTDAEANRQVGQGQAPQAPAGVPEADQGPDLGGSTPDTTASEDSDRTVKVGARDIVRPPVESDQPEGSTAEEGDLYDRLAKKDTTNAGSGPSGVA